MNYFQKGDLVEIGPWIVRPHFHTAAASKPYFRTSIAEKENVDMVSQRKAIAEKSKSACIRTDSPRLAVARGNMRAASVRVLAPRQIYVCGVTYSSE